MFLCPGPRPVWRVALVLLLGVTSALAQPTPADQPDLAGQAPRPSAPLPASSAPPVVEPSPALPVAAPAPAEAGQAQFKASIDDGLTGKSADGNFSLRLGMQTEFRYEYSDTPDKTRQSAFYMQMVRPQIRGNVVRPWLKFFIQPELAGTSSRLLDFELDARLHDAFNIRVGQFLTPYSRSFFTPVPKLQFPDFSVVNTFFRADRDTGIMLFGQTPGAHLLEYDVGVFNGNRINQNGNDDAQPVVVGRLAVNPLGSMDYDETAALKKNREARLSIGVNAYGGETPHTTSSFDAATGKTSTTVVGTDRNLTIGADLGFAWERLTLLIEVHHRNADVLTADKTTGAFQARKTRSQGAFVQAGLMVIDRTLELGGRFNLLNPSTSASDDLLRVIEGQLAYYVRGNNLKILGRFSNSHNEAAPATSKKDINTMTLQTQVHF